MTPTHLQACLSKQRDDPLPVVNSAHPSQMALAETITAVPWTVKPLYGFITDSFPIFGMRRRPYLILAGLLGEGGGALPGAAGGGF